MALRPHLLVLALLASAPAMAQNLPNFQQPQVGPDQLVKTYMGANHRALTGTMSDPERDRIGSEAWTCRLS